MSSERDFTLDLYAGANGDPEALESAIKYVVHRELGSLFEQLEAVERDRDEWITRYQQLVATTVSSPATDVSERDEKGGSPIPDALSLSHDSRSETSGASSPATKPN